MPIQPIVVNGGSSPLKTVLTIAALGAAGFGAYEFKKYLDKVSASNALKKQQNSTITVAPGKKLFDIMGRPIKSANLGTIATDIHDALRFPVDDARAVRAFQSTPYGYVDKLEAFYLDQYQDNLRDTLAKKLSDSNWIKIKFNFK